MANFQTINGLQLLTTAPTGDAGQAINSNFQIIGQQIATLQAVGVSGYSGYSGVTGLSTYGP